MISSVAEIKRRWKDLQTVALHYADFRDFYYDCSVDLLGFEPTPMQLDIAMYVAHGAKYRMVQAQRGEAKTTITGCYAVWRLLQDPTEKVLIISAGSRLAKQISTWCIAIIQGMAVLKPLRPDKTHVGTRTSVEEYDVHHDLVGSDRKSPSLACLGITSSLQGNRASLLIPDDVESTKNSLTQVTREQLRAMTREFTSINRTGDIVYLGTPQSIDSIYNDLPARGFDIRIWPGRFPTEDEESFYGKHLAPFIKKQMDADPSLRYGFGRDGNRGAATDPGMVSEDDLVFKEIDQEAAYFDLQFMLNTALTDAERFPLKIKDLMFYSLDADDVPDKFIWSNDPGFIVPRAVGAPFTDDLFRPAKVSDAYLPYAYRLLAVDPAGGGQNGDEIGLAVVFAVKGMYFVMEATGIPGGSTPEKFAQIITLAKKWDVDTILVEKNYGNGIYTNSVRAACLAAEYHVGIEEVYNHGQKELRIADALEPIIGAHKLVVNSTVPADDISSTNKYGTAIRASYQFLNQLRFLTREKGSLLHDDRLEAVAMAVKHLAKVVKQVADTSPKTPPRQFKGLKMDANGKWRMANRVDDNNGLRRLDVSVLNKFKR